MDIQGIIIKIKDRFAMKIEYGIDAMEEILDSSSNKYNDFILLKMRYNRLKDYINSNTLEFDKIDTGENKIYKTFLELLDSIELTDLKKQSLDEGIKNRTLSNRKANFFKLIDIYMQNLKYLSFTFDETNHSLFSEQKVYGREAIFQIYKNLNTRYLFENSSECDSEEENITIFFREYFLNNEKGLLEVYMKNIKHILEYINEDEIDKVFFLNTFKSLLSRFELILLFYFSFLEENVRLKDLLVKNKIIQKQEIQDLLFQKSHIDDYFEI